MDSTIEKGSPTRILGVVTGIVVDNKDPEGQYRVRLKFPWVMESNPEMTNRPDDGDFMSPWARVATLSAGPDRGVFWLPELGDEVLVMFEHGDPRRPFVVGALWSPVDKPIHDNRSQDGNNAFRTLFSRSGHVIQFIDDEKNGVERIVIQTKVSVGSAAREHGQRDGHYIVLDHSQGKEKIEISDRKQENSIVIDSTNNSIAIQSLKGDVTISAPQGTVSIYAKAIETRTSGKTKMKASQEIEIQGDSTMKLNASSTMTLRGASINLN